MNVDLERKAAVMELRAPYLEKINDLGGQIHVAPSHPERGRWEAERAQVIQDMRTAEAKADFTPGE